MRRGLPSTSIVHACVCPTPSLRAASGGVGYGRDTDAGSNEPSPPWRTSGASGTITVVSPKFAQLRSEALELPEEERVRLADELYESVEESDGTPEEIEAAWAEEIADRAEQLERGEAKLVDGREVFRRIRSEYGR